MPKLSDQTMEAVLAGDGGKLLELLDAGEMSAADKEEAGQAVLGYLQNSIIETTIASLDEGQVAEFRAALDAGEGMDKKIQDISATVPGLAQRLDEVVQSEMETLRAAYAGMKK